MLPQSYPNYKTVHRRFQKWCDSEVLRKILCDLANEHRQKEATLFDEAYIDGSFIPSRMGGQDVGYSYKGKGTRIMAIVDREGLPTAITTASAGHHEVRLVQLTVDLSLVEVSPGKIIGDCAYDSDDLNGQLIQGEIELIAPHKTNRRKKATQDRRALRRMKRRFTIERTFS